jgi:hypothetical protein
MHDPGHQEICPECNASGGLHRPNCSRAVSVPPPPAPRPVAPSTWPSLGSVVRYVVARGEERAALVTRVGHDGQLELAVFRTQADDQAQPGPVVERKVEVVFSRLGIPGTWNTGT